MIEQGGFKTGGDHDLVDAAAGRIRAAINHGQKHFDDMERGHQVIFAGVLAAILYHRESHESWYREQAGESGSRGFFSPSPHNTLHADPHRAFHQGYRAEAG